MKRDRTPLPDYRFYYKETRISKNVHRYIVQAAESEECAVKRFSHVNPNKYIVSIDCLT